MCVCVCVCVCAMLYIHVTVLHISNPFSRAIFEGLRDNPNLSNVSLDISSNEVCLCSKLCTCVLTCIHTNVHIWLYGVYISI